MSSNHPVTELRSRHQRVFSRLAKADADALIVEPGADLAWLTGQHLHASERLTVMILKASGEAFMVGPAFEQTRLESASDRYVCWAETDDPYSILAETLGTTTSLAFAPQTRYFVAEGILDATGAKGRSAGSLISDERMIKSAWELDQLREGARQVELNIEAAWGELTEGTSERDAASGMDPTLENVMVQYGPNGAVPHGRVTDTKLASPCALLTDHWQPNGAGYWGDLTRCTWIGAEIPERYKAVWSVVLEAQMKAIETIRPGIPCGEVDAAARGVIEAAGFGEYFTHRLGHGLGLEVHEAPYFVSGNQRTLEPGMVVTVEPGIYLPGEFGVRLEEDIVVTENGCELLSSPQRELAALRL